MGETDQKQGGDVFIVDNSDQDWKVRREYDAPLFRLSFLHQLARR